ncbi:MAG: hypothetical protein QW617_03820 [Acidilobaceae archaeon]
MSVTKKLIAIALLTLLLGATLIPLEGQTEVQPTQRVLSGWVLVPAVQGNQGRLINMTIQITYPGSGLISIAILADKATVDEITRLSAELAVKMASILAGYSWKSFDTHIEIQIATNITGPSGSFAIALLVYSLLSLNSNLSLNLAVTGAITPHGLASRVGGIPEKCSASRDSVLVLPLVNVAQATPLCYPKPVTGILNATASLNVLRVPSSELTIKTSTPQKLKSLLVEVAENISVATESVLKDLLPAARASVESNVRSLLEEARNLKDDDPYVAASTAFSAYVTVLNVRHYEAIKREGLGYVVRVLESQREKATALESRLKGFSPQGSQLYIEFASLAYARLADAVYHIGVVEKSANRMSAEELASRLAYIDGRLETVKYWSFVAEALRDEGVQLSSYTLSDTLNLLRDYSSTTASYVVSLVEYVVRNYPLDENTKTYMASVALELRDLVRRAEEEYARDNKIAALGYYRECLSKSLDIMSQLLGDESHVAREYYKELERIWTVIAAEALTRGVPLGMASLYSSYAEYKASRGDYASALDLMGEATISAILWRLSTLSYFGTPSNSASTQKLEKDVSIQQLSAFIAWSLLLLLFGIAGGLAIATIVTYLRLRREDYIVSTLARFES